ncbi:MAG: transcription elongation factor GreA [Candidatus Taylorbacteria bacterium RIFCSPLOWO2_01_FULL_45_15b]|uniref:Transcription elongation factor GreA n=1 Tax=Candidatus Taylorbacteria bacterium RIFCSPLOWO2_01_FULL_45_15b TaxID=1802319 RepID=A0A1G2NEM2_9BACT|nr:MAG: transcription elongation factor GreA [Candidatus Taylorbacteria bacterium RIFCSPLOWO2_01_FULL_45_15b]
MGEKKEYLTKEKFNELSAELDHLRKTKRKEVAEELEYAKSMGDLSENAEYHEAREAQASVEERISKLENILKNATIMEHHHTEAVGIGSSVKVEKGGDGKIYAFEMVGSEEVDVTQGKLSIHSPLGQAMLGKKKGETFSFVSPKGAMKYKIVDLE